MIIDAKTIIITLLMVAIAGYFGLKFIRAFALQIARENHGAILAMDAEEEEQRRKRERAADAAEASAYAKVKPILTMPAPPPPPPAVAVVTTTTLKTNDAETTSNIV